MRRTSRQFSKAAIVAVMLAALALAGCPSARRASRPGAPVAGAPPAEFAAPVAGATRFEVLAGQSLVVILAYRGGTLASFGHDHVIAARAMQGVIDVREPLDSSTFELRLPVAGFTVDEPPLRTGRGAGFESTVPESAREGTRRNMLGADLLDAEHFPQIAARSVSLVGGPHNFAARLELTLRGGRYAIEVPVQVERPSADLVHVTAHFPIDQSAIGLTPFSVMLGALEVENTLGIEVDLTARRVR